MGSVMQDVKDKAMELTTYRELATIVGVSASSISNYFKDEQSISFENFVKLCKFLYKDQNEEIEIINRFSLETIRKDNDKEALEWSSNHGQKELQSDLISKIKKYDNKFRLPSIYLLLRKRNNFEISNKDFYCELQEIFTMGYMTPEALILYKIGLLYSHLDLKCYKMISFLADDILTEIENMISIKYIKESYKIRVLELLAISSMKLNDIEKAKSICNEILNDENMVRFPLPYNSALSLMAELFVFESYDKSKLYIKRALYQFKKLNLTGYKKRKLMLEATHDFVKMVNYDFTDLFLTCQAEMAHYLALTEKKSESIEIIDQLEKKNGMLSAHQLYYKSLALDSMQLAEEAADLFCEQGDHFYKRLPRQFVRKYRK
jgi:transcriptional regulator with XRE-family HTH domain